MRTVWKFTLAVIAGQRVEVPKGAAVVEVAMQGPDLCMWALVDPDAPREEWVVRVAGTGQEVDPRDAYLGTAHAPPFVWHVFRRTP